MLEACWRNLVIVPLNKMRWSRLENQQKASVIIILAAIIFVIMDCIVVVPEGRVTMVYNAMVNKDTLDSTKILDKEYLTEALDIQLLDKAGVYFKKPIFERTNYFSATPVRFNVNVGDVTFARGGSGKAKIRIEYFVADPILTAQFFPSNAILIDLFPRPQLAFYPFNGLLENYLTNLAKGNYNTQTNKKTVFEALIGDTEQVDLNALALMRAEMLELGVLVTKLRTTDVERVE